MLTFGFFFSDCEQEENTKNTIHDDSCNFQ